MLPYSVSMGSEKSLGNKAQYCYFGKYIENVVLSLTRCNYRIITAQIAYLNPVETSLLSPEANFYIAYRFIGRMRE